MAAVQGIPQDLTDVFCAPAVEVPVPDAKPDGKGGVSVTTVEIRKGSSAGLVAPDSSFPAAVDTYGRACQDIERNFDILFQHPHIDALDAGTPGTETMRAALLRALSTYRVFQKEQLTMAQNLDTSTTLFCDLLGQMDFSAIVDMLGWALPDYVKQITETVTTSKASLADIGAGVRLMDQAIDSATTQLDEFLATKPETLKKVSAVQALRDALKDLINLHETDSKATIQLAVLLGVTPKLLSVTAAEILRPTILGKPSLAFTSIKLFRSSLDVVNSGAEHLIASIESANACVSLLADQWLRLSKNVVTIKESDPHFSEAEVKEIASHWRALKPAIEGFVAALSNVARADVGGAIASVALSRPAFPKDEAQLNLLETASLVKGDLSIADPQTYQTLRDVTMSKPVAQRVVNKTAKRLRTEFEALRAQPELRMQVEQLEMAPVFHSMMATQVIEPPSEEDQEFLKGLEPPEDLSKALAEMSHGVSGLQRKFNDLMSMPYADSLEVGNPFKHMEGAAADEKDTITVQEMISRYKQVYDRLQDETIKVIEALSITATVQLDLLPSVSLLPTPPPDMIPLAGFLDVYKGATESIKSQVDEMKIKHKQFQDKWDFAQSSINAAIEQCKRDIPLKEQEIQNLQGQEEKLRGNFWKKLFGGVVLIAAGAFLLPAGLVCIVVGAGLIASSIADILNANKLKTEIAKAQVILQEIKDKQARLEALVTDMNAVQTTVGRLFVVLYNISVTLGSIMVYYNNWSTAKKETLNLTFPVTRNVVIGKWKDVLTGCSQYVTVLGGVSA